MNICSDMEIAALTHRGLVREVNEDRHYVKCLDEQTLLMAVVDGMGGGPAGSAAAEAMREALTEYPVGAPHPEQALSKLVVTASEAILEIAHDNPALEGMGTTVTATVLSNGTAHWAHVGDTRFYVFRQGRLIQVTTDQTMAQLLVEEGREGSRHPAQREHRRGRCGQQVHRRAGPVELAAQRRCGVLPLLPERNHRRSRVPHAAGCR